MAEWLLIVDPVFSTNKETWRTKRPHCAIVNVRIKISLRFEFGLGP